MPERARRPAPAPWLKLLRRSLAALAVAFDMTFANRNRGGTRVYARALFNALRNKEGVAAWVVAGPRTSGIAGTMNWLLRGARREMRERPAQILHCPSFVAPWRAGVPLVVTVHDAAPRRFPRDHPLEWRLYDRQVMPGRLREAARVIAVSEFARLEVIDHYGLQPEKVVAIPNGIDDHFLRRGLDPERATDGLMLFPGGPIGRKNLDVVLRVMASRLQNTTLEISGAAAGDFPHYGQMISSMGLESRVMWLGHVPDMAEVIRRASVVVYPSLYEGFGLPPLEAMALGTPVVASNRGSLPEILDNAALLVDPEDDAAVAGAIESVLSKRELREQLRAAGMALAGTYTWDRCAERTLDVYRDVLHEHRVAV